MSDDGKRDGMDRAERHADSHRPLDPRQLDLF